MDDEKIKSDLVDIRENLLIAINNADLIYAEMMINRLDTLIYNMCNNGN